VTPALLLALAAAISAAAAITELLTAPRRAHPRPRPRPRPTDEARRIGHLAGMTVLLARIARRAGRRAAPRDLDARLAAAGAPLGLSAGDVVALKGAAAVGALLCAFTLHGLLPGRLGLVALLAAPVACYAAPELLLRRRARARARQISHEIADVLDLLRVAVGAGLPIGRAIGEVGRRMRGVLAGELAAASVRLQLGMPRGEVLRGLVARCPGPGVATLAAAIARSDRHGAPLAPALSALAADARAEQSRRVRDDAARAAPKIQLVVALVLVPAVMLLVAAVLVRGLS
jgi:tight adherence protein C